MLHPAFMKELLDDEVALAAQRLGDRAAGLTHDGRYITCHLEGSTGAQVYLRLDAPAYDAEPVRVAVCDLEGSPLPEPLWPPGLWAGDHPVTRQPFVCIRGVFEYYTHLSAPAKVQGVWTRCQLAAKPRQSDPEPDHRPSQLSHEALPSLPLHVLPPQTQSVLCSP